MREGRYRVYPTPAQDQMSKRGTKHCGKCNRNRVIKKFYKRSNTACGLSPWCKDCNREYDKNNQVRFKRTRAKAWYLRVYGITLEFFESLIRKQKGKCAICKKKLKEPHLDHCHKTKKPRGVLCHKCNVGLGHFNDNPRLLKRALAYLRRSF